MFSFVDNMKFTTLDQNYIKNYITFVLKFITNHQTR